MASSTQANQQQVESTNIKDVDWVTELFHTAILDQRVFGRSFSIIHRQPIIDIVVFYEEETNNPYGFGFVANNETHKTGGTFRRDENTASRLKRALFGLAGVLHDRHASYHSQSYVGNSDKGPRRLVNYIQFRVPFLEHEFSNYFNSFTTCDYRVVALFDKNPCGFGFVQAPPSDIIPKDFILTNYYNQFKGMVEEVKMIISGGLARSAGSFLGQGATGGRMTYSAQQQLRIGKGKGPAASDVAEISESLLGQGVSRSRMIRSVQQQEQRGESGSGSTSSEGIFNTARNTFPFQATAGVAHYEAPNAPSSAHLWGVTGQSSSGSFDGGHPNPTIWPRSSNDGSHSYMQQPESFLHSQPRAGAIPNTSTNRASSAHFWSGTSAGVTGQIFSGRIAGQQETNRWSGSQYGGEYSNTVMQQQPQPSTHHQTTAWPLFDEAANTTSSSSFGATAQLLGGNLAGGQPTTDEWSQTVGANRTVQNRDARGQPPPNSTRWPGTINNVTQHQAQSFHYQPTAGVIPHAAINIPSDAEFWSGMSAGVTGEPLSDRLAGQQGTNQLSGHGGGYSYTGMQQPPKPSINCQSTDITPSFSYGPPDQVFGGSLSGGQPAVGANRPLQNRDAVNPEWNMWK